MDVLSSASLSLSFSFIIIFSLMLCVVFPLLFDASYIFPARFLIWDISGKWNDMFFADLSNDSYTTVNMGVDGEGASPGGGGNGIGGGPPRGYLGATTPPYLSTSRSPSLPPQFPYPPDAGLSVYTTLGKQFSAIIHYVLKRVSETFSSFRIWIPEICSILLFISIISPCNIPCQLSQYLVSSNQHSFFLDIYDINCRNCIPISSDPSNEFSVLLSFALHLGQSIIRSDWEKGKLGALNHSKYIRRELRVYDWRGSYDSRRTRRHGARTSVGSEQRVERWRRRWRWWQWWRR